MDQIKAGLAAMWDGSGVAQSGFNSLQMTDEQYQDLTALQALTTQVKALLEKYQGS